MGCKCCGNEIAIIKTDLVGISTIRCNSCDAVIEILFYGNIAG